MRIMTPAVAVAVVLSSSVASAAARVVVLPVVVGSQAEPAADLMTALARGLSEGQQWRVFQGPYLKGLMIAPAGLKNDDRTRLAGKLDEVAAKIHVRAAAEAIALVEPVRTELAQAAKEYVLSKDDFQLAYRAAALHVAALLLAGETDRAKNVASEVVALFPGHRPEQAGKLPPAAVELLSSAIPESSAKLTLQSHPDGCDVILNGASLGRAPVEVAVVPGATYQAQTICNSAPADRSFPRRITIDPKDTNRQEVLDAEFEKTFAADGGQRVRFASTVEQRQLEESTARRVAERYGADSVVLAAVGELHGADWLSARLYLSSGYLSRQGLVRLETARAVALGRYLATGQDVPGVLKPEEAGALATATTPEDAGKASRLAPWYSDVVGWCFTGAGVIGVTLGIVATAAANNTMARGDAIRGDSELQMSVWRDAQRQKFLAGIGLIGGGLILATGVVLLIIPEYKDGGENLVVFSPTKGGGVVGWRGTF
jgi:hypothetical protein